MPYCLSVMRYHVVPCISLPGKTETQYTWPLWLIVTRRAGAVPATATKGSLATRIIHHAIGTVTQWSLLLNGHLYRVAVCQRFYGQWLHYYIQVLYTAAKRECVGLNVPLDT